MKGIKGKKLSTRNSVEELVVFFESHDMGKYWEKLPKAEVQVSIDSKRSSTKT
jgi:hypothetical protein